MVKHQCCCVASPMGVIRLRSKGVRAERWKEDAVLGDEAIQHLEMKLLPERKTFGIIQQRNYHIGLRKVEPCHPKSRLQLFDCRRTWFEVSRVESKGQYNVIHLDVAGSIFK